MDQKDTEIKENTADGPSEFEKNNSRLHTKTFSLIITKNLKAKALRKQSVPERNCFVRHT